MQAAAPAFRFSGVPSTCPKSSLHQLFCQLWETDLLGIKSGTTLMPVLKTIFT
ncbi:hypothetical protein ACS0TY_017838 [Phlomoides rotata]